MASIAPGTVLDLTIEKPAVGGPMIARHDGRVVLVSGAIPGERVRARVVRAAKGVVRAETLAVEEPSSDRRPAGADPLCGGCLYSHIAYPRQLAIKSQVIADAFGRIGRLPLASPIRVTPSPEDGYRMRARLHVRESRVGFFREGTHDLCDAKQTRQLLPSSFDALERLGDLLKSRGIDAREIELSENVDASDRAVAFDTAAAVDARTLEALGATDGITGIVTSFGTHGRAQVRDRVTLSGGETVTLQRHVHAFFQGNRFLLETLVRHVVDQVPADGELIDLYAGVGLFSVAAATARGVRVTAVEGDRFAAADLATNAASAGALVAPAHQSVEDFVARAGKPPAGVQRTVIVDPPRTGLSKAALDGVVRLQPSQIVYVSCDVATLARDARRLVDADYLIDRVDGFDLFPNTPHVETVVTFRRV